MKSVRAFQRGEEIVSLRRSTTGQLLKRSFPVERVAYFRMCDFSRLDMNSIRIESHRIEGEWLRVSFTKTYWQGDAMVDPREVFCKAAEEAGIETFEGDLSPVKRWLVENEVEIDRPIRTYLDIETDSRKTFDQAIEGQSRILAWSLVDEFGTKKTGQSLKGFDDRSERELLNYLFECLADYDQIVTWNGSRFDQPVLLARADILGVKTGVRQRWNWLDFLEVYQKYNIMSAGDGEEKSSMKLQDVAFLHLGEGKHDVDASAAYDQWLTDPDKLLSYCINDSDLIRRIEEKTNYLETFQSVCEACGVFPDDYGLKPTNFVEQYLLREGKRLNVHFKSKWRSKDETPKGKKEKYKGAFVLKPTDAARGIVRDVHVGDFASMYPSIMLTWNLSEDAIDPDGVCVSPGTGLRTSGDRRGVLSVVLEGLLGLRAKWSELLAQCAPGTPEAKAAFRKTNAYKQIANSVYGVLGNKYSRLYNRRLAESVTLNGQYLINATIEEAKKWNLETIYGDTDSIFVIGCSVEEFQRFVDHCNEVLYPTIAAKFSCKKNYNKFAFEKSFDRLVFSAGKKYIGRYLHYKHKPRTEKSKPEIKGLEIKRGETIRIARRLQQSVVDLFDKGCDDPIEYAKLIDSCREIFYTTEPDVKDITIAQAIKKAPEQYASRNGHVGVALLLKSRGEEIHAGSKIRYIILDARRSPMKVIPASDFTGKFDRNKYWRDKIYPPTRRLVLAMFPNFNFQKFDNYSQLSLF